MRNRTFLPLIVCAAFLAFAHATPAVAQNAILDAFNDYSNATNAGNQAGADASLATMTAECVAIGYTNLDECLNVASQPQAAPAGQQSPAVSGLTLRMVDAGSAAWVQTGPQQWSEVERATGKVTNRFEETFRSESEVKLYDSSRGLHLSLQPLSGAVLFAYDGSALQPFTSVVATSDQSRIPGSDVAWDTTAPAPQPDASVAATPQAAEVTLVNDTTGPVDVYWENAGTESLLATIPAGTSATMETAVGHQFSFVAGGTALSRHTVTGTAGEQFLASGGQTQVAAGGTPAGQQSPAVSGLTLRMVDAGSAAWVQTGPQQWSEVERATGKVTNRFEETFRSESEVKLYDSSRGLHLSLQPLSGAVLFAYDGSALQPFTSVVATSDQSRIPGSDVAWDTTAPAPQPDASVAATPQAAEVTLVNDTTGPVDVYWENAGTESLLATIPAATSATMETAVGHQFSFVAGGTALSRHTVTGTAGEQFLASGGQTQVAAGGTPAGQQSPVTGLTMKMAEVGNSAFVQTGEKTWSEVEKATGTVISRFEEISRSEGQVVLLDRARSLQLGFLVGAMEAHFATEGSPMQRFGTIVGLSDKSLVPGSDIVWDSRDQPVPVSQFAGVTGQTVRMVEYESGAVVQVSEDRWVDVKKSAIDTVSSVFNHNRRGETWVELHDPARNATVVLDLAQRQIYFGPKGADFRPLYTIANAGNESVVPGSTTDWDRPGNAFARKPWRSPSGAAFLKDADTSIVEGGFRQVTFKVAIHTTDTTEGGQDEVFYTVVDQRGVSHRVPKSGTHSMNEDDKQLESWGSELQVWVHDDLTKRGNATLSLTVMEEDNSFDDQISSLSFFPGSINHPAIEGYSVSSQVIDYSIDANTRAIEVVEKSPQVQNVTTLLGQIAGSASMLYETEFPGFLDLYDARITNDDHPGGIALTPGGRLVTNMALANVPRGSCGVVMYSESIFGKEEGEDLGWKYIERVPAGNCLLPAHPSAMQAVGEIVAMAGKPVRFVYFPKSGAQYKVLDHLTIGLGGAANGGETIGITYNAKENRFFAFWSGSAGVTDRASDARIPITIYATDPGLSLLDDATRWKRYGTLDQVFVAGQGANLITDSKGDMYLVSFFSSDETPPKVAYAPACSLEYLGASAASYLVAGPFGMVPLILHSAAAASAAAAYPFTDIITATKVGIYNQGTSAFELQQNVDLQLHQEVGRTQSEQFCVLFRPAWRFAGGVAPISETEMMALWAGRYNMIMAPISDFEFAMQRLVK